MTMKEIISKLVEGRDLTREEAHSAMKTIMSGEATQAQIGGFLTALRVKGETIVEIAESAKVMREFASTIHPRVKGTLVDTCGTGGDRLKTFNISTIASFVVAGAGIPIAKHGNRSVTSKCGSADVLEALEVKVDTEPREVERIIEKIGIGFMFAPLFHGAMKHAIGPRRELGIRTVFNILGPLTNPANAEAQVLGVFSPELTEKLAGVLKDLRLKRALVVHGMDGLDEISTIGETRVSELKGGQIETYTVSPEDFGLKKASPDDIAGGDAEYNAELARRILRGEEGGARQDIVELNAGAGIYVGGGASSIEEGMEVARESIESGRAYDKLLKLSVETRAGG
ncbi:MAG: anthranilate phosphoribosyltransferase [Methanobacteriota archaeon]|nr:MAG: anthranilate phosphoribosyltransferase [Euryarchaeota archaeon]